MLLHELLDSVDVLELRGDPRTEIASVTHDSRAVGAGDLFCCVPGSTADGHDHAPAAVAAGAAALLVERPLGLAGCRGRRSPRCGRPWARWRPPPGTGPSTKLAVLGVTGTNGKTTTTYLLEAIARAAGIRPGVIGTIGARIDGEPVPGERTTPEATELQALLARMVDAGVGLAAIEVSSHALVMHRVDGTRFAAACFTNLSHDHLDFHAGLEEYFEAKALLFDPARTDAAATNLDDPHGAEIARRAEAAGLSVLGFGLEAPAAAVRAEGLDAAPGGNRFRLVTPYGSAEVHSPLVGPVQRLQRPGGGGHRPGRRARRRLGGRRAVGAGRRARAAWSGSRPGSRSPSSSTTPTRRTGWSRCCGPPGRWSTTGSGRLVVVFGCGGDRDRAKRPAMGKAAAALADVIVVTSDNPRSEDPMAIIEEVVAGVPVRRPPDRRARPPGGHGHRPRRPGPGGRGGRGRQGPRVGPDGRRGYRAVRRPGRRPGGTGPARLATDRDGMAGEADSGRDRRDHRRADPGRRSRHRRLAPIPSTPAPWPPARCSWRCGPSATGMTSSATRSTAAPPGPWFPGRWRESGWSWSTTPPPPSPPSAGPPATAWPDVPVVGITGSTGKTSTKDLDRRRPRPRPGRSGPARCRSTTRSACRSRCCRPRAGAVAVVAEMGARGVGHIATLAAVARPTIGVITNIGMAHAEFFGSREEVARAKGELLEALPADGHAVLCADDDMTPGLRARTGAAVLTAGASAGADVRVSAVQLDDELRPRSTSTPPGVRRRAAPARCGAPTRPATPPWPWPWPASSASPWPTPWPAWPARSVRRCGWTCAAARPG